MPETATLEGSQETVKETKEEGATVTDDKDATATGKISEFATRIFFHFCDTVLTDECS